MNENIILLVLSSLSVMLLFVTFVYVIGIVWRVEMELDLSYKFLSAALLFLIASETLEMLPLTHEAVWWNIFLHTVKLLAALCLFIGMFFMRDLVRRMDGEKK
jgi:hypothetical protein